MRNPSLLPPLATLAALVIADPSARAANFDPARGKIDVTGSAYAESLDAAPAGLVLFDDANRPLQSAQIGAAVITDESASIEGTGALEIGGTIIDGFLDLRSLAQRFSGHRVEARLWQRAHGTRLIASILWVSGSPDPLLQNDDFQTPFILTEVTFQPTGRATDDGWQEWTTGPFDFSAGGMLPATLFAFYDSALADLGQGVGAFDIRARVRIDAFTIDDLGPALVPNAACNLLNEGTACGAAGLCMYGRCTDAALAYGSKLENKTLRTQYLSRRVFEFQTFEGGRSPLSRMPQFSSAVMALANDVSTSDYWTTLSGAVQDLEDGHASAPVSVFRTQVSSGVCMHLGEADLLPSSGPSPAERPLIFSAPSTNPVGSMLKKGDALMRIDGASIADWSRAARRYVEYHGDPAGRELVTTPALMDAAMRTGALLEIARCPQATTSTTTPATVCTSGQVVVTHIDLAALASGVWAGTPPSWHNDFDTCDYRFRRAVDTAAGKTYAFAGYADDAGVRWVQFNGVPSQYEMGGQQWFDTMTMAFSSSPTKMLLDERLGDGGAIQAVDLLASFLLSTQDAYSAEMIPQLAQPVTDPLRGALRRCNEQNISGNTDCGGFFEWLIGEFEMTRGAASTGRLAVLLGQDVSGNDFITKMLSYRHAPTRIFGGAPTFGAFGVIWILPSIAGEAIGGSLQAQDSIFRQSSTDPASTFATSTGIPPDAFVLEKQSDAVRNIDTAVQAAKAWLNQ